jgi:uncharacterized membrane protein YhaH (DUF805 family)
MRNEGKIIVRDRLSFMYLSLGGRIRRRDYWLFFVLPALVLALLRTYVGALQGGALETLLVLCLLWPAIAVQVKRWHDQDFSGWWALVNLVPVVGWLIALVLNGCAAGTRGENQYGPEPFADR